MNNKSFYDDPVNDSFVNEEAVDNSKKESRIQFLKQKEFYLRLICSSFAELIGTTLYVFVGLSSLSNFMDNGRHPDPQLPTVALAFGFSYAGLSAAMQHVSGGHLNPAITVGVLIAGGINVVAAIFYFIAQVLGGIIGASFVLIYKSSLIRSVNQTTLNGTHGNNTLFQYTLTVNEGIQFEQVIIVELLLTIMLVTVFIHTSMEKKGLQTTSPALCGLTSAAGIMAGYRINGGSLNPARSFGPVVVSGDVNLWKTSYVYWIGPLIGGVISGLLYRLILSSKAIIHCNSNSCINHKKQNKYKKFRSGKL